MTSEKDPPDPVYRHYLREWREHRGLQQEQLAKMVGASKSVISRFETGERPIKLEMQFKLMRALRISPPEFFSPPPPPPEPPLLLLPPEPSPPSNDNPPDKVVPFNEKKWRKAYMRHYMREWREKRKVEARK